MMGFVVQVHGQEHSISMEVQLDDDKRILQVQQRIVFFNDSDSTLTEIFLHDWASSYKNKKSPLAKRLIEDFDKSLYFAREKDRGYTDIKTLKINGETTSFSTLENHQNDVIKLPLNTPLKSKESSTIDITYSVKIPKAKFTRYGKTKTGYHLRYWYLVPAIFKNNWKLMSNLNMDDLVTHPSSYSIKFSLPKYYYLNSSLHQVKSQKEEINEYELSGENQTEVLINIDIDNHFKSFKTNDINVLTDLYGQNLDQKLTTDILNRQLLFIKDFLGEYPHKKLFIDKITQAKNPIYGLNQLPRFIRPFPDVFEWDLTMLKALTDKFINNTILVDKRKDYWLTNGLQTYLLMLYVSEYYPEIKLTGNISKIWGLKNFNFSKLSFNDKYPFVYQFSARQFLDQALTTRADSLSNFNRKVISKYKAGLGLKYLADFIGDSVIKESFKELYDQKNLKPTNTDHFKKILSSKTNKDIEWFFDDFLKTNKKIDYTIKKTVVKDDSVLVTVKNKRNISTPVPIYGLKNKKIKFKKWLTDVDSSKTIAIPKNGFDRVSLNFENSYPEFNSMDNSRTIENHIFNKPIKFKLYKDINDPYYNQLYLQPDLRYNFYDGLLMGVKFHNQPILERNFEFSITPLYGEKSNSLNGTFISKYTKYFENSNIDRIFYSLSGSNLHYAEGLSYNSINQRITVQFRRKNLRDAGGSFLSAMLVNINREINPEDTQLDSDKYQIFKLKYYFNRPSVIKGLKYSIGTEFGSKYSKAMGEIRYRKLTARNTQLDFRLYAGAFLNNNTNSDFFSFGLDRANDYLYELNYIGRSESSGLLSQQFIMAEGGFKSVLDQRFANDYLVSFNSSVGIWRWLELYNDVAFLKNNGNSIFFAYENGIRLNFIHNIFEIYLPIYSNNGWEINEKAYPKNMRFVLVVRPQAIYNFFRRGLL